MGARQCRPARAGAHRFFFYTRADNHMAAGARGRTRSGGLDYSLSVIVCAPAESARVTNWSVCFEKKGAPRPRHLVDSTDKRNNLQIQESQFQNFKFARVDSSRQCSLHARGARTLVFTRAINTCARRGTARGRGRSASTYSFLSCCTPADRRASDEFNFFWLDRKGGAKGSKASIRTNEKAGRAEADLSAGLRIAPPRYLERNKNI